MPVLFGFFIMGFCDIVGISSDYASAAFGWNQTTAGLVPSAVFVWFFFLGVPIGTLMNRIGRKNTVILSCLITVTGMVLPVISYTSLTTLTAYALLGVGNAILQVSLNPLLQNVITNERMLTASLTAGQVVKAISSFLGPFIIILAVHAFGNGDDQKWYLSFPLMGAITLLSGLWILLTPIPREKETGNTDIGSTFKLFRSPAIIILFFGIFFAVGTDVSTNFISSKIMISRYGYTREAAGIAPQIYFILRTFGAFIGMFMLTKVSERRYFRYNMVICILAVLALAFIHNATVNLICIGAIGALCSCVFPIIYGMAIKSMPDKANEISGLMIMAVAGGTVSFIVGAANDIYGMTGGTLVILLEVLYLSYCAFRR